MAKILNSSMSTKKFYPFKITNIAPKNEPRPQCWEMTAVNSGALTNCVENNVCTDNGAIVELL